jgi:hypothetical protein
VGMADKIVCVVSAAEMEKNSDNMDEEINAFVEKSKNNKFIKQIDVKSHDGKKQFILGYEGKNTFVGSVKTYKGY